jgi:aminoglycoside phosphotransferase (APT) family kinase protein
VNSLTAVRSWLLDHQPPERRLSLCHGDAMMANYMFRGDEVVAVLDWELAFLGNPAHDIAWQVLTHAFLGLGCEPLDGMPTEEERKAEYERISGKPLADWQYCCAVSALKLHIALLLVYREVTPEMQAARKVTREHTWHSLQERLAAAQRVA